MTPILIILAPHAGKETAKIRDELTGLPIPSLSGFVILVAASNGLT